MFTRASESYVVHRFKTDVRMLPQFGPLEALSADTPGQARNGGERNADVQHARGERMRKPPVTRSLRTSGGEGLRQRGPSPEPLTQKRFRPALNGGASTQEIR